MTKEKIQVIYLQTFQSGVASLKNMFAAEAVLIWFLRMCGRAEKDFTRNEPGIARPSKFSKNLAHDQLRSTGSITFGVVEKIDPTLVRFDHQRFCDII
jgi:hypothetical protein